MKLIFALFSGIVFGTGIALSGMMDPAKVLNFFDVAGSWDPSLKHPVFNLRHIRQP